MYLRPAPATWLLLLPPLILFSFHCLLFGRLQATDRTRTYMPLLSRPKLLLSVAKLTIFSSSCQKKVHVIFLRRQINADIVSLIESHNFDIFHTISSTIVETSSILLFDAYSLSWMNTMQKSKVRVKKNFLASQVSHHFFWVWILHSPGFPFHSTILFAHCTGIKMNTKQESKVLVMKNFLTSQVPHHFALMNSWQGAHPSPQFECYRFPDLSFHAIFILAHCAGTKCASNGLIF